MCSGLLIRLLPAPREKNSHHFPPLILLNNHLLQPPTITSSPLRARVVWPEQNRTPETIHGPSPPLASCNGVHAQLSSLGGHAGSIEAPAECRPALHDGSPPPQPTAPIPVAGRYAVPRRAERPLHCTNQSMRSGEVAMRPATFLVRWTSSPHLNRWRTRAGTRGRRVAGLVGRLRSVHPRGGPVVVAPSVSRPSPAAAAGC